MRTSGAVKRSRQTRWPGQPSIFAGTPGRSLGVGCQHGGMDWHLVAPCHSRLLCHLYAPVWRQIRLIVRSSFPPSKASVLPSLAAS